MSQVFGTQQAPLVEIISGYASAQEDLLAVAATPGWHVVGAFFLKVTTPVRLQVVGSVSHPSLALRSRVFDLADAAPVSGSEVSLVSLVDARAISGSFTLQGGRVYQFQSEAVGSEGADRFGTVKVAEMVGA